MYVCVRLPRADALLHVGVLIHMVLWQSRFVICALKRGYSTEPTASVSHRAIVLLLEFCVSSLSVGFFFNFANYLSHSAFSVVSGRIVQCILGFFFLGYSFDPLTSLCVLSHRTAGVSFSRPSLCGPMCENDERREALNLSRAASRKGKGARTVQGRRSVRVS